MKEVVEKVRMINKEIMDKTKEMVVVIVMTLAMKMIILPDRARLKVI